MIAQKDRILIETNHSGLFKQLLVLMLRERIASVEYDCRLAGKARDQQNFDLNEQRLAIRTLLRTYYDSNEYIVAQFHADLSKPAAAIHFTVQPRKGPVTSATQRHFRVELPFELWEPEDRMADIVGHKLVDNPAAFDPATYSTPETRKP